VYLRHVPLTVLFSGGNPAEGLATHPWEEGGGLFFLVAASFKWGRARLVRLLLLL